jgi:hypothetical protein
MPSYIPKHVHGRPWPKHLRPRDPSPLPDIDLRKLFEGAKRAGPGPLPTLIDCGGVFFLTLMPTDRMSIATTIERLIDMLDAVDGDPDLEETGDDEPSLGVGVSMRDTARIEYDLEADHADSEPSLGWTTGIDQSRIGSENPFDVDLEADWHELDAGDFDIPGFIWGGNEDAEARS